MSRTGVTLPKTTLLKSTVDTASKFAFQGVSSGKERGPVLKFSLSHITTLLGCAPPEATYIAAHAGYDLIGYRIISMGLTNEPVYDLANNKVMLHETKKALADTGLTVLDIELARIADDIDVKSYLPNLETAAELGAHHVIASIWTSHLNYAKDCLAELCDLAQEFGLTINLEFVTFASVATLQQALEICSGVNRNNCGILIDTLHFHRSRVQPEELDAVPREWLHFAHVCDAPKEIPTTVAGLIHTAREERLDPGEGAIDLAAIMNRLPEIPYSIEIPNVERVQELGYAEHARLCLENTKKYFSSHPRA
jgi:sugar phosphate isomerase/epimerase